MNNVEKILKKHLNMSYLGSIEIGNKCMVSDPCYDENTWCQYVLDNMKSGQYNCFMQYSSNEEFGKRVRRVYIYHHEYISTPNRLVHNASIGVDSGQAGFYDYEYFLQTREKGNEDWIWYENICDLTYKDDEFTGGVKDNKCCVSSSGYGDGCYSLFIHTNSKDEIVSACIEFTD